MRGLLKRCSPRSLWGAASHAFAGEPGPPRLLTSGSGYERHLLASARVDIAPSGAAARVEATLGDVLVEGALSGAAAPLPAARSGLGAKQSAALGVLGAGVLAVLAGSWYGLGGAGEPAAASGPASTAMPLPAVPAAPAPQAASAHEGPEPPPSVAEPARPSSGLELSGREKSAAPASHGAAVQRDPARVPRAADPARTLLEEVRALDAIRAALRAADTHAAAQRLARYRARYPKGELQLESEVLAVELAVAEGRREGARARARTLLARPGARRYAEHLRRVLEGSEGSNAPGAHIR